MLDVNHSQKDQRLSVVLLLLDIPKVNSILRKYELDVRVTDVGLDPQYPDNFFLEVAVLLGVEKNKTVPVSVSQLLHGSENHILLETEHP